MCKRAVNATIWVQRFDHEQYKNLRICKTDVDRELFALKIVPEQCITEITNKLVST